MKTERVEYPISPKYCESWKEVDALREIIANELDLHKTFHNNWTNGVATISDKGYGIPKEAFILGEGTKQTTDKTVIGQFGEGLKIAALVLARQGKKVEGETVGFNFSFVLETSTVFNKQVLVVYFYTNTRTNGTILSIECSKEGYDTAIDRFLHFKGVKNINKDAILPQFAGNLYSCGQWVGKINSLFGYNTTNKSIINRDRTVLDMSSVGNAVRNILEKTRNLNVIETIINNILNNLNNAENGTPLEKTVDISPAYPYLWKAVLQKHIDINKTCLSYGTSYDNSVIDHGFKVLNIMGWYPTRLINKLGVKYSNAIAIKTNSLKSVKKLVSIENTQRLKKAKTLIETLLNKKFTIRIVDKIQETANNSTVDQQINGMVKGDIIYLPLHTVNNTTENLLGVLLHEAAHVTSRCSDISRAFEQELTNICGKLASKVF